MKKKKIIWWVLIVVWCGGIFFHSSMPGHESQRESMFIVRVLNRLIGTAVGHPVAVITDGMVRKAAHFSEYLVLGCLLFQGYCNRSRLWQTALFSFCTGILYAASDELHQHFVPGRNMRLIDLAVDSTGVIAGIFLLIWISGFLRKRSR